MASRLVGRGLHLDLITEIVPVELADSCWLSIIYNLSSSFIVDQYQVQELVQDGRLLNISSISVTIDYLPRVDLELPFERVKNRSESAVFHFGQPLLKPFSISLPLHLRSHLPLSSDGDGFRQVSIEEPLLAEWCLAGLSFSSLLPAS